MIKTLAIFALALSLFAIAPAAHAQNSASNFNVCSATLQTGQNCAGCQFSCISGDNCASPSNTCQPVSGNPSAGSTANPSAGSTVNPSAGNTINPSAGNTGSTNSGSSVTLLNPLNSGTSLPAFLSEILAFIIKLGTVVIVLMVVYVGFKFVMAQGEPGAISEARQALLWTVVGALILLGAQAIASAIQATANAL